MDNSDYVTIRECSEYRSAMRHDYCQEVAIVEERFAGEIKELTKFIRYVLFVLITLLGEVTIALLIFVLQMVGHV